VLWIRFPVWPWIRLHIVQRLSLPLVFWLFHFKISRILCLEEKTLERELIKLSDKTLILITNPWLITQEVSFMRRSLSNCLMRNSLEAPRLLNSSIRKRNVLNLLAFSVLLRDWCLTRDSRDRRRVRFRSWLDSLRGRTLASSRMKHVRLRRSSRNRLQSWSRRFSHWLSSRSTSCSLVLRINRSAWATSVNSSRRSKMAKKRRMDHPSLERKVEAKAKARIRRESEIS